MYKIYNYLLFQINTIMSKNNISILDSISEELHQIERDVVLNIHHTSNLGIRASTYTNRLNNLRNHYSSLVSQL
jgi:hypothetical protein